MTKIIILPDMKLDEYYERTLAYLRAKYHSYPSLEKYDRQDDRGCEAGKPKGKPGLPDHMKVR